MFYQPLIQKKDKKKDKLPAQNTPPPKKKPASKSMQKYSYAASCFILTCLIHETKVRSRVQQEGNSVKKIDKVNLIWFYEQNHWNTPVVLTYIVFFICIYTEDFKVCIWIFYSSLGSVLKVFRISNSRYLLTNDYDMHCCDFKRSHFLNNVFFFSYTCINKYKVSCLVEQYPGKKLQCVCQFAQSVPFLYAPSFIFNNNPTFLFSFIGTKYLLHLFCVYDSS